MEISETRQLHRIEILLLLSKTDDLSVTILSSNSNVSCVEGKTHGLRDGDECEEEVAAYKDCRQRMRETTRRKGATAVSTATAATVLAR